MKKSIYVFGIASVNLMLMGCIFKVLSWPGANPMIMLSVFLFAFVFLPVALINGYRKAGQEKYLGLYIATFAVFSIGMMSVLFKVLHWPGNQVLLLTGILLPFILFLPVYLYQTRNEKSKNNMNFLGIMFGLMFLAVFSVLLTLRA